MNNKYNPALFWFAVLNAVATFLLIGLGGLVTSHEAGMSVPDWPTSYGYNMFALPIKFWTGGAFFEHTHRLLATLVGTLTAVLAVWLWVRETKERSRWLGVGAIIFVFLLLGVRKMPVFLALLTFAPVAAGISIYQFKKTAPSLRWLGMLAFALVVPQGVLGGLRVVWAKNQIGIFHGALAQFFFVFVCAIALFTSRWWQNSETQKQIPVPRGLRKHILYVTILIFIQLLIAATMRHQHAGLAISDFPLAHGKIWPDTSAAAIASYNEQRIEVNGENPITAFQVNLQMIHRLVAYTIFLGVAAAAFLSLKKLGGRDALAKFAFFWLALLTLQIVLGAATIWTNKAADIATLHVMVGALALLTGALWWLVAARRTRLAA